MIIVFIDFELIYYFKISLQIMPANKMMCSNNSEFYAFSSERIIHHQIGDGCPLWNILLNRNWDYFVLYRQFHQNGITWVCIC